MNNTKDIRQSTINSVIELLSKKETAETISNIRVILEYYCKRASIKDLRILNADDCCGSLLCLWQIMQEMPDDNLIVKVYNSNPQEHNWHSTHSIIEIVTKDIPFLLSSLLLELNHQDLQVYNLFHPILSVKRNSSGKLISIKNSTVIKEQEGYAAEILIRIEIDRQNNTKDLHRIKQAIIKVINKVYNVVTDWIPMRNCLSEAITWYKSNQPVKLENSVYEEEIEFLEWILQENFLFIGYKYGILDNKNDIKTLTIKKGTGLGSFRDCLNSCYEYTNDKLVYNNENSQIGNLIISKSPNKSNIHRPGNLDYIGIRHIDKKGFMIGEWQFIGLFSSSAYSTPIDKIPLVRKKIVEISENIGYSPRSHQGQVLRHLLNHYPRDELLQANVEELTSAMRGILNSQEKKQLKVVIRKDAHYRFISIVMYLPRDKFNTELRIKILDILVEEFYGTDTDFNVRLSESLLAQLHFIVYSNKIKDIEPDSEALEDLIAEKMLDWSDHFNKALFETFGEAIGSKLRRKYSNSFHEAYKEDINPRQAIMDVAKFENMKDKDDISTTICRPVNDFKYWQFRVVGTGKMFALSDVLPILDKIGVRVISARTYSINTTTKDKYWLINFSIELIGETSLDDKEAREQLHQVFVKAWKQEIQNDGFNALTLLCNFSWKQIVIIRALAKYLLQLQVPFSQNYMQKVLKAKTRATKAIIHLFEVKFLPDLNDNRKLKIANAHKKLQKILDEIENIDEDRILRYFITVVDAIVRTNAYMKQDNGKDLSCLSFKLLPTEIPAAPLPRPMYEIFVYSADFEGIHMRSSKVARGGLRWSDRREDFRTEILGLVKAQMIKNAVIVPHGAKGGFVLKKVVQNMTRDEFMAEGIRCYKLFISSLLDITDNLIKGKIVSHKNIIKYDDDDPYLVVAADKGTATFSDIANEISLSYNFWLGDAFASGGSQGYDHKKMGITAKGAWESVKCLFLELGIDTQNHIISVVGIGDMSGDVFGNGMLLSKTISLIAAFNHRHIFIDPKPDLKTSYNERKRLFELPRSSWDSYNTKLISKGGGVYSRQSKSIEISEEAKKALLIDSDKLTPNELINAILKAPVDLLWNGGIGTYVKASFQDNSEVGDITNDTLRVNANELHARVVGEGGNLGFTQQGRIEFAKNKGLINTDAVDNSAGVDCSDHEVNIKILLNQIVSDGDITIKQRNELLVEMTDEVAKLVLNHNKLQSLRLSLSRFQNIMYFNDHRFIIRKLEDDKRLDRTLDCLPEDVELKQRGKTGEGLTQPEISILLSNVKMSLSEALVANGITKDSFLAKKLLEYFPTPIQKKFKKAIDLHPLKNEILGTHLANEVCNRMGAAFIHRLQHETKATEINCVQAYLAVKDIFSIETIWHDLERSFTKIPHNIYIAELFRIQRQIEKACVWLLRQMYNMDIAKLIEIYKPCVNNVAQHLAEFLGEDDCERLDVWSGDLQAEGVPAGLADRCASLRYLYYTFFINQIVESCNVDIDWAAHIFFALEDKLSLPWIREMVRQLPVTDLWKRKAVSSLHDQIDRALTKNCISLLQHPENINKNQQEQLNNWIARNKERLKIWDETLAELKSSTENSFSMMSVAIQELAMLAQDQKNIV